MRGRREGRNRTKEGKRKGDEKHSEKDKTKTKKAKWTEVKEKQNKNEQNKEKQNRHPGISKWISRVLSVTNDKRVSSAKNCRARYRFHDLDKRKAGRLVALRHLALCPKTEKASSCKQHKQPDKVPVTLVE